MSLHQKLKTILIKKFPNIQIIQRIDKSELFWIEIFDVLKIIEMKHIPKTLNCGYIRNKVKYFSSDCLLKFLISSKNPHHIIDYLVPLEIEFKENILLEVVRIFDKYGIRGTYNYNMSETSNCLNFNVAYYYHCPIPLLIDVYSEDPEPMKEQLYSMFSLQKCKCVEIDTRHLNSMKNTWLATIESHLVKLNSIIFMSRVIKEADEIKDDVMELGEDTIDAMCAGDNFPFSLKKTLKKFSINENNPKYTEIMSLFETNQCIENKYVELNLEPLDENSEFDLNSDDSSDSEECDNDSCNVVTQLNENTLYIEGIDYMVYNDDYYLSHPTLIKIAIRSGVRRAEQYVDKTWKLVKYITSYGKSAYQSLLKMIDMTPNQRKEMFSITNTTFEQNRMNELAKAHEKIEELESYLDINKTKKRLEREQKIQKESCDTNFIENISNKEIKITKTEDVFIVEKQPTKIKPSSIVKKTKQPVNDNELEEFLGLT